jgi:hypothetical protein
MGRRVVTRHCHPGGCAGRAFIHRTRAYLDDRSSGHLFGPRRLGARGKDRTRILAIVKALAELSAQKRDETLPDNEAVGRQFGDYIKTQAKTDHDQLLYAIVDRAVRKYGKPAAAATK